MSKTIKNCFLENLTFIKLLQAHERAKNGKSYYPEIIRFEMDLESNLMNLLYKIKQHKYHNGRYREFYVYEPKERLIKSLPYPDRIIHQWYIEEFIKPYYSSRFIYDTYACLPNKGGHKAVERTPNFYAFNEKKI